MLAKGVAPFYRKKTLTVLFKYYKIKTKNTNIHDTITYWIAVTVSPAPSVSPSSSPTTSSWAKNKAKGDGSCDVKQDSSFVTIAYNHYRDTGKGALIGQGGYRHNVK